MSDYGASITFIKKDGLQVTDSERQLINNELLTIKENSEYSDCVGEDFLFQLNSFENDKTRLHLMLSEYWHGDGDDEENFEFSKDNDLGQVEEIAEKLKLKLGQVFEIKPDFEAW